MPQVTGFRDGFCHTAKDKPTTLLVSFRVFRWAVNDSGCLKKGTPMKKQRGVWLVTLFMALILNGENSWQISLPDIAIRIIINQSR